MRTATTVHLIGDTWTCTHGPADVPAKNGLPADKQRLLARDLSSWPKDSRACVVTFSDGKVRRYYRNEAELIEKRMAAAKTRVEEKAKLAVELAAKQKADEAKAAEAAAKANAEANAKHIAEKEARKSALRAEREAAPAARVETQPKTKPTAKP